MLHNLPVIKVRFLLFLINKQAVAMALLSQQVFIL